MASYAQEPLVSSIPGDTLISTNIFRESPQVYLANEDWRVSFSLASTSAYKTFGVANSYSAILVCFDFAFTSSHLACASQVVEVHLNIAGRSRSFTVPKFLGLLQPSNFGSLIFSHLHPSPSLVIEQSL